MITAVVRRICGSNGGLIKDEVTATLRQRKRCFVA